MHRSVSIMCCGAEQGLFFFSPTTKNFSLASCSPSASCLGLLKFPKLHHLQFIILIVANINEGRLDLVLVFHLFVVSPPTSALIFLPDVGGQSEPYWLVHWRWWRPACSHLPSATMCLGFSSVLSVAPVWPACLRLAPCTSSSGYLLG